jgi:hypothetical protein
MTFRSVPFFRDEYLPTLSRLVSYTQTARALGLGEAIVYVWLRESKAAAKLGDDKSVYFFEYQGEGPRYFHQWVKLVHRASIEDIEANARARARDGYWRPCRFQGKTVWRDDPKIAGYDDKTLDMLGYPDRLLRINGELQPEMEWIPAGTDLVIAVLQSNSETYRRRSSIDMNVNQRVSGGLMVVGGPRPPALPMVQVIEQAEPALDDILGPEPVASDEPDMTATDTNPDEPVQAPGLQPGDRPMIREAPPAEYATVPNPILAPSRGLRPPGTGRPLSDAELSILRRTLPSANDRGSK